MELLSHDISKEKLMTDLKTVMIDTEALLKATANASGEKLAEIRAKAEESLGLAKATMMDVQATVLAKTKEAAKVTDAYVHENPWRSIGLAASLGVVIGLLIGRR
jgi:ElaB/YqjD/DUF883 family membrane-anchored ribosome-binding protein